MKRDACVKALNCLYDYVKDLFFGLILRDCVKALFYFPLCENEKSIQIRVWTPPWESLF